MLKRSFVRLIILGALLSTLGACMSNDKSEVFDASQSSLGISTEHPLSGVSQTACGWKVEDIKKLHQSHIYYVAVPDALFQGGKNCGRIIDVTIGGACYENHDLNCAKEGGHASLAEFEKATGKKPPVNAAKLYIADSCGSCLNDSGTPHLDISNEAYVAPGPLADLRNYLTTHVQAVKQSGTSKTSQPNNLFLSNLSLADCAPGLTFQSWVAKGHCNTDGAIVEGPGKTQPQTHNKDQAPQNMPKTQQPTAQQPSNSQGKGAKGQSGFPYCGAKTYGKIFYCGPSKCSKSDPQYLKICELKGGR